MKRVVAGLVLLALLAGWHQWNTGARAGEGAGWGTVKGQIVYGGDTLPVPQKANLDGHQDKKACLAHGEVYDETWIVSKKNKGVRFVFIWLEAADPQSTLPVHPTLKESKDKEVVIDQPGCSFIPHAAVMREGQVLVAKNSAPVPHNFKWNGHPLKNPGGNILMPPNSEQHIKDLVADKLPVSIACNIHPWMKGWVRVYAHPYYALTDENGTFEIKNAPAGECRIKIWHEGAGWRGGKEGRMGQPITVKADGVTDLGKLDIAPPK